MDITATNGNFLVSAIRIGSWKYKWNKDHTLSIWDSGGRDHVHIVTNSGDFIEAVDKQGSLVSEGGDGDLFLLPIGKQPVRLRFKKLPDPQLSSAFLDKHRQRVVRYLLQDKPYNCGIPDTLSGTIQWMQKQLAQIPKASRAKASFGFDTTTEYGETYPQLEITYQEMESDDEVVMRVQVERERARIRELGERKELERLEAKYK